jgi:hypothetical protein
VIPIGKKGRIKNGVEAGQFVYVEDNLEQTGGFLIHTAPTSDCETGMDDWVDKEGLEQFFKESGWQIDWFDSDVD